MSDFGDGNERVSRTESGVTVEKSFDGEEFAVPAIRFELRSDRDDAVTVRITDRIPNDFPMDNVGFHPEYENENWTAYKDHRVQFERTLEPGETLTTVYGVRLSDWQDAELFLSEPELEEVAPVGGDAEDETEQPMEEHTITDIVSEDSSQVVRDVIAGDSGLPGLDGDAEDAPDPLAESGDDPLAEATDDPLTDDPLAAEDGSFADDPFDESTDAADDDSSEFAEAVADEGWDESDGVLEPPADDIESAERVASPPRPGSVAAALADEIRAGEVNDDDLTLIQRELDLDTPESTNVRIRHLQSRVDDLAAYTEALEEFIDDNGPAQSIIEEFENEVEAVRGELDAMNDDIESAKDEGAQARARVADLEGDLSALESELDELGEFGSDVDDLRSQLDDLEDLVATNTAEAAALDDEVEDIRDDLDDVQILEGELETLSDDVADLSNSVSATEARLDEKLDALRSDLEAIEGELTEFREWREQLGSVFGGN